MNETDKSRLRSRARNLPEDMIEVLESMINGAGKMRALTPYSVRQVICALELLVARARLRNRQPIVDGESLADLRSWMRRQGVPEKASVRRMYYLQTFKKYMNGEGSRPAYAQKKDLRELEPLLAKSRWAPLRAAARASMSRDMPAANLRCVDRFLTMPRRGALASSEEITRFCKGSLWSLKLIRDTLAALDPKHPELSALRRAISDLRPPDRHKQKEKKSRRVVSIEPKRMPSDIREALGQLNRRRGARKRKASGGPCDMEKSVCQLLKSAELHGLALAISEASITAYIDDLNARDLKAVTKLTRVQHLERFLKPFPKWRDLAATLREDISLFREDLKNETGERLKKLTTNPVMISAVGQAAANWRANATRLQTGKIPYRRRRRLHMGCALLALLSVYPLRLSDLRNLTVGVSVKRCRRRWHLRLKTSKSGQKIFGQLPDELTAYLDGAITLGADVAGDQFWQLYGDRVGTPLFSMNAETAYSPEWFRGVCIEGIGHCTHAVRHIFIDATAMAVEYDQETSTRVGHGFRDSRKPYEVFADSRRLAAADEMLAEAIDTLRNSKPAAFDRSRTKKIGINPGYCRVTP